MCAPRVPPLIPQPKRRKMIKTTKLTQPRIDALKPPVSGEYTVHDAEVRGLSLRVRSSGSMVWSLRYRVGGRNGSLRRLTLGDARKVSLKNVRVAAIMAWGERAKGTDPQSERKNAARQKRAQLGPAVERYITDLDRRGAAAVSLIASILRRELVAPLAEATDLATLDRARLASRITAIADSGRPGAAREFRTRASVFMNWCVGQGLIEHNPLLGLRLPRATRAEEITVHGRALKEAEIRALWQATEAGGDPVYTGYLRALLFTGCRRTELAQARWRWLQRDDAGRAVLMLPREITKNGRAHAVPLPTPLLEMLGALPRFGGSDLIFPSWRGNDTPMSGWSKRWAEVVRQLEKRGVNGRVTMHDLRRTARSWWSELGVSEPVAELMLNHRPRSRLVALYDRSERMDDRHQAADRWAERVFEIVEAGEDAKDAGDTGDAPGSGRDAAIRTHEGRDAVSPSAGTDRNERKSKVQGGRNALPAPAKAARDAAAYLRGMRARA